MTRCSNDKLCPLFTRCQACNSSSAIDVALHKTLDAQGERHVRPVAADHADGRRSITLVRVVQSFSGFTLLDVTLKTKSTAAAPRIGSGGGAGGGEARVDAFVDQISQALYALGLV